MRIPNLQEIINWVLTGNEKKVYKHKYWTQVIRPNVLKRDHSDCQMCKRKGKRTKATVVHHIEELKDCPSRAYDMTNLEAVCRECHEEHHERFKFKNKVIKKELNEEKW